jgi:xylulokinase
LSSAYREYPLVQPREDWVELEPRAIWQAVKETLREAGSRLAADPVRAIGVSSQGETVTAVDRDAENLCNFIVTFDNRTVEQVKFWERTLSRASIYRATGMPLHPMYSINKILWIKEHLPEVYRRAYKFTLVEDFVIARLCGEFGIDYTLASRSMAFDVEKKRWSREILRTAGVEESLLSPAYPSGTAIGTLKEGACGGARVSRPRGRGHGRARPARRRPGRRGRGERHGHERHGDRGCRLPRIRNRLLLRCHAR